MPLHYTKIFGIIALLTVVAFILWLVWISVFEGQTFEKAASLKLPAPAPSQTAFPG